MNEGYSFKFTRKYMRLIVFDLVFEIFVHPAYILVERVVRKSPETSCNKVYEAVRQRTVMTGNDGMK